MYVLLYTTTNNYRGVYVIWTKCSQYQHFKGNFALGDLNTIIEYGSTLSYGSTLYGSTL